MNTEIEILESQYRTARQNRRQAKQALDTVLPEYEKANDICEQLTGLLSCLKKHDLRQDAAVIHHMLVKFGDAQGKLYRPYENAASAYRAAVHAEEECRKRLDEAEQATSLRGICLVNN